VLTSFLPLLAFMIVFNNLAEEIAWTGFLFARLQERHRPLVAALLVFVPFWCWHVLSFAHDTGSWLTGLLFAGLFALPHLASRVMTGWLYNSTGAGVLMAGMFHATFNATVNPYGFGVAVLELPQEELPYVVGGLVVLAAVVVAVATRGRLGQASDGTGQPGGSNRTRTGRRSESGSR
jgi:membrane protease YdiL (CAAX protease family)